MIEAYKKLWSNYFNFNGRSTVSDYWWVVLANFIIGFIIGFISAFVPVFVFVSYIYSLAVFIPSIAIVIRRLHDINKSGWNYLWVLLPFVGWIILIVFLCTASVDTNNRYGQKV